MKCDKDSKGLRKKAIDNLNASYDKFKDEMMSKTPDELWEECYAITFHRNLYMYLISRLRGSTLGELQYLQSPTLLEELKDRFYKGTYTQHYSDFQQLVIDYIREEKTNMPMGESVSTRSNIAMELEDGKYKVIYCHCDGYLEHNGALLLDHYSDREKLEELMKLGNLSVLGERLNPDKEHPHSFDYLKSQDGVCLAYGRDRGETKQEAKILDLDEMFDDSWIEYFYIFTLDNKWKYYDHDHTQLKDVQEDLDALYEEIGFPRPKGYYGFWTDTHIEEYKKENGIPTTKKSKQSDEEM